ncbi:MAG: hypothetical protein A3J69_01950 [Candidatus Levybacteria bacterium RIFCSPHIGHO2_02_FULL_42_12]|nr:MAG: hypothetical protein A2698_01400 [Candidatus Levybacteria bacterium RIFCSPHIGHO2_01_FULL_42_15]OGH33961.1 MAG: hypothetical protein A3J69_01950 [Candidatus Levybacteria bacterium RIFCSPHIGHO2_02_FULL_42_12]OGH42896.1 MAG: hypothetical protein A3B53_02515 [Candidatus Levybacteria bacterium RIFCSPLOWO2_01_FULL_42_15]
MKKTILILHGWGVNGEKYQIIVGMLKEKGWVAFSPDLPGFGKEKLLKKTMNVDDYVDFVRDFIRKKKLSNIVLVGHSFGGRIAIKLAASGEGTITGLILTGSAGIKPKLALYKRFIMYIAILLGELFRFPLLANAKNILRKILYFAIGEWDYYNAGDIRETFKKVIAEDLIDYLHNIRVPTLLVWGAKDNVIQLIYGKMMKERISASALVVVEGAGHKLPYANPKEFINAIMPFLQKI